MRARASITAVAIALAPAALLAQTADSIALAGIARQLDATHYDSARSGLERWRAERLATARERDRATADLLAARLESDGVAAQHAYLGLALAHPFGSLAGLALLRVGQAAVLQGDTAAAIVYLNRLVDDFPGGGHGPEARLWLSRAHFLAGRADAGCQAARDGLAAGASAEVQRLLRIQEARACARAVVARPADGAAGVPVAGAPAGAPWAVQSGAFRSRTGADALVVRLERAGLQPRLVRVPGSELMRVRVGAFASAAEAVRLRDRLRDAGFDAVVVDDAARETRVP